VFRSPKAYGITDVWDDPSRDLALWFNYQVSQGMEEEMAEVVYNHFLEALPTKENAHYYVHDVYRILYAKRLRERGEAYPTWLPRK
jgi:hypothetical protein